MFSDFLELFCVNF